MKTTSVILLLIFTGVFSELNAQFSHVSTNYVHSFQEFKNVTNFEKDNMGNIYTFLETAEGNGGRAIKIFKHNQNGVFQWSQVFIGNSIGSYQNFASTMKNGFIYASYMAFDTVLYDENKKFMNEHFINSCHVVKLNLEGDIIFNVKLRPLDYSGWLNIKSPTKIAVDNLDNIFVAGNYHKVIIVEPTVSKGHNKGFIAKFNSNGVFQWQKDNRAFSDTFSTYIDLKIFDSQNIYLLDYNDHYSGGDAKFSISKLNQSGTKIFDTLMVNPTFNLRELTLTKNNHIVFPTAGNRVNIMNSSGNTIRRIIFPIFPGSNSFQGVTIDGSNNLIMNGRVYSGGKAAPFCQKYSFEGVEIFRKIINIPSIKNYFIFSDFPLPIDSLNNIHILGNAYFKDSIQRRGCIIKLDSAGNTLGFANYKLVNNSSSTSSYFVNGIVANGHTYIVNKESFGTDLSKDIVTLVKYKNENIAPLDFRYDKKSHTLKWLAGSSFPEKLILQKANKSSPDNWTDLPEDSSGFIDASDSSIVIRTSGDDLLYRFKADFFSGTDKFTEPALVKRGFYLRTKTGDSVSAYEFNKHAFMKITNSDKFMWPVSWWLQFNYEDPALYESALFSGSNPDAFPDFKLAAEIEGYDKSYISFPNHANPGFVNIWKNHSKQFNGSCFGFSSVSLLNFLNDSLLFKKFQFFKGKTPANEDINDSLRKMLNFMQNTQIYGKFNRGDFTLSGNPNEVVTFLRDKFSKYDEKFKYLIGIQIPSVNFNHAIFPYAIETVNENTVRIYVYDSNVPANDSTFIEVDILEDKWKYREFDGGGFIIDGAIKVVGNLLTILPPPVVLDKFIVGKDSLKIFASGLSSLYIIKENNDTLTGFDITDTTEINREYSYTVYSDGIQRAPAFYTVPNDNYKIVFDNYITSNSKPGIFLKDSENSYTGFERTNNTNSGEKDIVKIGDGKITYKNPDAADKIIKLIEINESGSFTENVSANNCEVRDMVIGSNDSVSLSSDANGNILLNNYSGETTANILLTYTSASSFEIFNNFSVSIPGNGGFLLTPNWDSLNSNNLTIQIDSGNNGTYEESIVISNQPLPVELSSFESSVDGNKVNLKWITMFETNNAGFEIERKSSAEEVWSKLSFVNGSGSSLIPKIYTFEDRNLEAGKYQYRLKQIDFNGNYKYYDLAGEVIIGIPRKYSLSQNYPNPFNPTTKINYDLPFDSKVTIKVFDMTGREVAMIVNLASQPAGYYTVQFNGASLASGVYFYNIIAEGGNAAKFITTKKMVLVK